MITEAEITAIKKAGFEILNKTSGSPESFINKTFPHCNLAHFLSEINKILTNHCPTPAKKVLTIQAEPPELSIGFYTEKYELAFFRKFYQDDDTVNVWHELFALPEASRNKGVVEKIFQVSLQEYVNMGVRKIFTRAGLDSGGYVWAKNHFTAFNRAEMDVILKKAESQLSDFQYNAVKKIYDNYYTKLPTGNAFPIVKWANLPFMKDVLLGTNWHGSIDLQDKEQFSNFMKHVFR